MKYSVIIPVYNRPDEVDELLESLCRQHFEDFEVVVVEDGSDIACQDVVMRYADRLDVRYFSNPIPDRDKHAIMVWSVPVANMFLFLTLTSCCRRVILRPWMRN